ncbi:TetR/AcrR family transcriptional regulator [Yinghuangia sp. YIM S09857]|uniref:TetR/AcrR family transcriptional regulator n=1 Tax=Yinghuangia sp. YIM S09857 TaxID=3436929 RepID=UPI003F531443
MAVARRASAKNDDSTREKVVDAAIACILDKGFYRASSNEIARRAGVSWGVIQHHFGNRESLMVAALRAGATRLEVIVEGADVDGDTLEERLTRYWEMINSYYGRPEYLVHLEITLNLLRDPAVSQEATQTIVDTNKRLQQRFLDHELTVVRDPAAVSPGYLFHALRGLAISHATFEGTVPLAVAMKVDTGRREEQARSLIQAVAAQIDGAKTKTKTKKR